MKKLLLLLAICFSIQVNAQEWKSLTDSARFYIGQNNNSKAVEFYLLANDALKKDSAVTVTYYMVNNDLADLYTTIGQYAKAEPFFKSALAAIEKAKGKNVEYAATANNLGRVYRFLGRYPESEAFLAEAREIRANILGKQHPDYASTCNNLAALYLDAGYYDTAKALYVEALQIREKVLGKEHVDYAASCNNLAIYYMVTGQHEKAEPLYIEAKRIREKVLGRENPIYAASLNNLGALYLELGRYSKAEPLYIEARQVRKKTLGEKHPDYAASCDNLAILYLNTGQYEKAEPLYLEAMKIREEVLGKNHHDYARSCNNIGLLYRTLGQWEKAEPLLNEARQIWGQALGKEHPEYAKITNNLGAIYMDLGDYKKATQLYEEARLIWIKVLGKEHPEYAKSSNNLASIQYYNGNYDKAEELFIETNTIREKVLGSDHPDLAASLDNLAVVYKDKGDYAKALPLHTRAKEIREKNFGTVHSGYLETCINLGNLYWNTGELDKAYKEYQRAFASQQALVDKIFLFTTEPEKQAYVKKINEYRSYFLSFSKVNRQQSASYPYAVSLAYRNLVLESSKQLRNSFASIKDSSLLSVYHDWISAKEQLAFWYTKPLSQRRGVADLEEKANALEKLLTNASAEFGKQKEVINWEKIKSALKPGEAAIEFTSFQFYNGKRWTDSTYYTSIILRADQAEPQMITLFEQKQLDSLLRYRNTSPGQQLLGFLYKGSQMNASGSLYKLVWEPVEKFLKGINTVYYAPSGSLHKLALSAIPLSNSTVMSDRYRLVQLSTTAGVAREKTISIGTSDKIILYGGVSYNTDSTSMRKASLNHVHTGLASRNLPADLSRDGAAEFLYLSGAEKEVDDVARLAKQKKFNASVVSGAMATEESFKALSLNQSPEVIHLATHGFFFPDPGKNRKDKNPAGASVFKQSDDPLIRSGLALSGANHAWKGRPVPGVEDGILTAYEVSNSSLLDTKLAVLSACETGLGDIQGSEGVYGLQRAFRMAGAEYLLMSLWKVPDAESAEFMQEFYKNIFNSQSISDAFLNAQNFMKNKYRMDPYKWAAWILVK